MKKKILLLGGNGFIGKNIIEQLGQKYDFSIPTSRELDLRSTTQVDRYFSKKRFDVVINAAVIGGSRREEYEKGMLEDNLRMFFNIVRNKSSWAEVKSLTRIFQSILALSKILLVSVCPMP